MPIYVGYSDNRNFNEVRSLFDVNPNNPDRMADFEIEFGSGYIDPGSYEIYDMDDFPGYQLNDEFVRRLFPFSIPDNIATQIVTKGPKTFFFIKTEEHITKRVGLGLQILSEIEPQSP